MKHGLIIFAVCVFTQIASAKENCYQLSDRENVFSRTPESLCTEKIGTDDDGKYTITFKSGIFMKTIAVTQATLMRSVRDLELDKNLYTVAAPLMVDEAHWSELGGSSVLRKLATIFNKAKFNISFDGKRDYQYAGDDSGLHFMGEKGTVAIANLKLFYRMLP